VAGGFSSFLTLLSPLLNFKHQSTNSNDRDESTTNEQEQCGGGKTEEKRFFFGSERGIFFSMALVE